MVTYVNFRQPNFSNYDNGRPAIQHNNAAEGTPAAVTPTGPFLPKTPTEPRPPSPPRLGDSLNDDDSIMSFGSADSGTKKDGGKVRTKKAKVIDTIGTAKAVEAGPLLPAQQDRDAL